MIFCMMTMSISTIQAITGKTIQRMNYGVLFKHVGLIDSAEQYWKHSFEIKLPTGVISTDIPIKVVEDRADLIISTLKHVRIMRINATETLDNTISQIKQLLPNHNILDDKRMTRSILPLGNIFKGLFGVASESDIDVLRNHMKEMSTKTNKLMTAFKSNTQLMNSWMTAIDKRVNNAMDGLAQTYNLTTQLAQSLNKEMYVLDNVWSYTARLIAEEAFASINILSSADKILIGVQKLMEHKMPIELIPLDILHQALAEVSTQLKIHYRTYSVPKINSEYYYSQMPVSFGRVDDSIFITINIPITSTPSYYNIYQVLSFPIPVNQSSNHTTQIKGMSPYIAIATNDNSFIEIKEFQFSHCLGNRVKHCPFLLPRRQSNRHTCTSAIFFKNKQQIKTMCDFIFIRHNLQSDIVEIDSGKLLITDINDIWMSCDNKITKVPGCKFCLIVLPCYCTIKLDHMSILNRITNCDNNGKLTKTYPVNLAVLHHFFNDELSHIGPDTVFNAPIHYKIPSFDIYKHKLHELIAKDDKVKLNLKKMAASAKNNQRIYQSISEPILSGEWLPENTWTSNLGLVSISAMATSIFTLIICAFLAYRLRVLLAIVSTLQLSLQTTAMTNKPLIWNEPKFILPTDGSPQVDVSYLTLNYQIASFYLALVFVVLFSIFVCMFRQHLKRQKHSKLFLKLSDETACVQLLVLRLPKNHHTIFFKTPYQIETLCVEKSIWLKSNLLIRGPQNKLFLSNDDSIQLPYSIRIPCWKVCSLTKLIKHNNYSIEWIIKTDVSCQVIKVNAADMSKYKEQPSTSLYPSLN